MKPLLLGLRIDPGADDKGNDVEEWHPCMFWQELLGEGESQRRGYPADLHHWQEAGSDGSPDLVECPCAGDHSHGGEVDGVLNWGNLDDTRR